MIPSRLADLISTLEPGQAVAIHLPSLSGARNLKSRLEKHIRRQQGDGVLTLSYRVSTQKHPTGSASVYVACEAPAIVEVLQQTEDGEIEVIKREEVTL